MDLCAADRATKPPYPFEIRKASGEAAAGFCKEDQVVHQTNARRIWTDFDVVGGQCKMTRGNDGPAPKLPLQPEFLYRSGVRSCSLHGRPSAVL